MVEYPEPSIEEILEHALHNASLIEAGRRAAERGERQKVTIAMNASLERRG
jgi:hypothetical protein